MLRIVGTPIRMPRKPVLLPCPVCELGAVYGGDREDGDKEQVDCSRCGRFEISGTALAMVASRIHQNPLVRARLSHAIRLNTSQNDWFLSAAPISTNWLKNLSLVSLNRSNT
jgi:hypothetical protein